MAWQFPVGPFHKFDGNPILHPNRAHAWESKDVFNPAAVVRDGLVYLLYRAEDEAGAGRWNGTSRIGLAVSRDGLRFERRPDPVLEPTEPYELPGGCEDPRICRVGDTYYLTYTGFDGKNATLALATSHDLVHWVKHGPILKDFRLPDGQPWTKSGAILPEPVGGRYWMYFGDSRIWIAWSYDLLHWEALPNPVLVPSSDPDAFDSLLVEPGPSPVRTADGILLIYNGAKATVDGPRYAAGQALFAANDPTCLMARTDTPFLEPTEPGELEGQVDNVVFVEGLVHFQDRDLLYYGMADSRVGVAIRPCRDGCPLADNRDPVPESEAAG